MEMCGLLDAFLICYCIKLVRYSSDGGIVFHHKFYGTSNVNDLSLQCIRINIALLASVLINPVTAHLTQPTVCYALRFKNCLVFGIWEV